LPSAYKKIVHTYEWLHAVCNAQVIAVALLWGEYGRFVAGAVRAGFDTDSNGATVGSLLGLLLGTQSLPDW